MTVAVATRIPTPVPPCPMDRGNRSFEEMAQERLVPLSVARTWRKAVPEWVYRGERRDHLVQIETCELCCEHPIRYHFKIINELIGNELWVGSDCIERFQIRVIDPSGEELAPEDAPKLLRADRRRMREDARPLLDALDRLADADPTFDAGAWKRDIGRRRGLTSTRRRELLARFEAHEVEVAPSVLKLARSS